MAPTQESLYAEIDLELSWSERRAARSVERTKHVHSLHPYLGKFVPQLVEVFLARYFAPGDRVYDPFVGSGTTLVEANTFGADAIGCDISAFNCLLTASEDARYSLGELELGAARRARGGRRPRRDRAGRRRGSSSWYAPRALSELLAYRAAVAKRPEPQRDGRRVVLARAARSARLDDALRPRFPAAPASEPYYCLKHKRDMPPDRGGREVPRPLHGGHDPPHPRVRRGAHDGSGDVLHDDSRTVRLPARPDGVITSPPYPGLIDYHEQHRYAYELLGLADRRDERSAPQPPGAADRASRATSRR